MGQRQRIRMAGAAQALLGTEQLMGVFGGDRLAGQMATAARRPVGAGRLGIDPEKQQPGQQQPQQQHGKPASHRNAPG